MNYLKTYIYLFFILTGSFSEGFCFSSVSGNAYVPPPPILSPPTLRCASVQLNGDVEVTWLVPPDPGNQFESYQVYASNNIAGPFSLVGIVPVYGQNSFMDNTNNANATRIYYYVLTRYYDPAPNVYYSSNSDTLSTIKLNVANPGNGTAVLSWNTLHTPPLPSSLGNYSIYKEYPSGTWTMIGSTTNLNYIDTITVCSAFINYRVEIADASGCSSFSSTDGKTFTDIIGPSVSIIDSVSIDPATGETVIGWNQNTSPDVVYYSVFVYNPSQSPPWVSMATVNGISNTFTSISGSSSICGGTYAIAAFDSCALSSLISTPHKTICLQEEFDACKLKVKLTWNKYINWTNGVRQYEVRVSTNGGPFTLLGATLPNDTTFLHTGLVPLSNYCYIIRAVEFNSTRSSSSNKICISATSTTPPAFSYMKYVTVNSDSEVELSCLIDTSAEVLKYEIQRSLNNLTKFDSIWEVNPATLTGNLITYRDNDVQTNTNRYTYRVVAKDECDNETFYSTIGKTMLLQVENDPGAMVNKLQWDDYIEWDNGVESYNIYRSFNGVFDPLPIVNIPFGINIYDDNIVEEYTGNGEFCYYIEALESSGNQYNFKEISLSNKPCIVQTPNFYVPNAFAPFGSNPIFIPKFSFVDPNKYQLMIFNRWGEKYFETSDPNQGWDGTYKGGRAPEGVYIYKVKYHSADGHPFSKTGTVTLIK